MGLSSLPTPCEGVFSILLVNTALSISIFKYIVLRILHIVGVRFSSSAIVLSSSSDSAENCLESTEIRITLPDSIIEKFRRQNPAVKYDKAPSCECSEHECPVCLTQFKPESEINRLSCDHLFHKVCLDKWLDYWNITCPICRASVLPEEDASCFW